MIIRAFFRRGSCPIPAHDSEVARYGRCIGRRGRRGSADGLEIASPADDDGLLRVDEALEKFAAVDPRKAELVKLRYFVGMSFDETATALGITVPAAKQWWAYGRAWLTAELRDGSPR